jgi:hypothetical protein
LDTLYIHLNPRRPFFSAVAVAAFSNITVEAVVADAVAAKKDMI